jgi:hypothetical protein
MANIFDALQDPEFWSLVKEHAREPLMDVTPGVGDVRAAERGRDLFSRAYQQAGEGDWVDAASSGAEGLAEYITTVPVLGDIAGLAKGATAGSLAAVNALRRAMPEGSGGTLGMFVAPRRPQQESAQQMMEELGVEDMEKFSPEQIRALSKIWRDTGVVGAPYNPRQMMEEISDAEARLDFPTFSHVRAQTAYDLDPSDIPVLSGRDLANRYHFLEDDLRQQYTDYRLPEQYLEGDLIAKLGDRRYYDPKDIRRAMLDMGYEQEDLFTDAELFRRLTDEMEGIGGLEEALIHDELFDRLIDQDMIESIGNLDVSIAGGGSGGSFDPVTSAIEVEGAFPGIESPLDTMNKRFVFIEDPEVGDQASSTLLHEVQHAIQNELGWPSGSNVPTQRRDLVQALERDDLSDIDLDEFAYNQYLANPGEVLARTVQRRRSYSPEQLREYNPYVDYFREAEKGEDYLFHGTGSIESDKAKELIELIINEGL